MNYKIQVGNVFFDINSPYPFRWESSDEQFMITESNAEKKVTVEINAVESLPEVSGEILHQEDNLTVMKSDDSEEIRIYRAMFAAGYPAYAQSRWDGKKLKVYYDYTSNLWNNANAKLWNFLHLENLLLTTEGIVLHCCYIMYKGQAILFSAPSGTGKTTQAELWKKRYGAEIVNGDKCLLQKQNDEWEAWGYPFHGSAKECINENLPIRAIVIVRQGKKDSVEELSTVKKLGLLFSESTVNSWNSECVEKSLDLLMDLVQKKTVIMQHCTMEKSAPETLHDYLFKEDINGII